MDRGKVYSVLGNSNYGLYFGVVKDFDRINGIAEVLDCRHICAWYGLPGGITSLASHGICGPDAMNSRVALPSPRAVLRNIVNVFDCTELAAASIIEHGDKGKPSS